MHDDAPRPPETAARSPWAFPAVTTGLFVAWCVVAHWAVSIIAPVVLALAVTVGTSPLVARLGRLRLPRAAAAAIVFALDVALLAILLTGVVVSFDDFASQLPRYQPRLEAAVADLESRLGIEGTLAAPSVDSLLRDERALSWLTAGLRGALSLGGHGVLALVVLALSLYEASAFRRRAATLLGGEGDPRFRALATSSDTIHRFLLVKTGTSVLTGLLALGWLLIWGVDSPGLWAVTTFLLNFIPYFGSLLAAIPPVLVAGLESGPTVALAVAGGYLAINVAIGNVLEPYWMGRALGLSPLVIVLSLAWWAWILGPVGALLSAPLTLAVQMWASFVPSMRWLAVLLGGPPPR